VTDHSEAWAHALTEYRRKFSNLPEGAEDVPPAKLLQAILLIEQQVVLGVAFAPGEFRRLVATAP